MHSSERNKRHVVVLPYYCDDEVSRYLQIAKRIAEFPKPHTDCDYLLAASPKTQPSKALKDAYSKLGRTISFQCPTQVFGYPEGPTAMFWDCMDFIAEEYQEHSGFALWLESDMAPIKADWIDRLSDEWYEDSQTPVMMGCFVPDVYSTQIFQPTQLMLDNHINGGGCYAMDFARKIPEEARTGVFDMAVYQHATKLGLAKKTRQIAFSTNSRVRRDLSDPQKLVLHGFMQEKDEFISRCLQPLSMFERLTAVLNPVRNQFETLYRRVRVLFLKHNRDTVLEQMFLSKQRYEANEDLQRKRTQKRAA